MSSIFKVGRNDLCPCGSGKKYKKCCMTKAPPSETPLQIQNHEEHFPYCAHCGKPISGSEVHNTKQMTAGTEKKEVTVTLPFCSRLCELYFELEYHSQFMPSDEIIDHLTEFHGYTLDELMEALTSLS